MKKSLLYIATALLGVTAFSSCDDNFEQPPLSIPTATIEANTTIAELKAAFYKTDNNYAVQVGTKADGSNYIIHGTVITSDEAGNYFKQVVIADETSAIQLDIDAYDLYESYQLGQDVVLDVTGLYVGAYGRLMQIGDAPSSGYPSRVASATFEEHAQVNGLAFPDKVVSSTVTIEELNTIKNNTTDWLDWQCRLITIENVSFVNAGKETLSTSGSNGVSQNITDASGNTVIVYTSGYSDFYDYACPTGTGSVTGILSCYNANWQIRLVSIDGLQGFDTLTKDIVVPTFEGDGTEAKPYTVADLKGGATGTEAWVKGYIVGWVDGQVLSEGATFNSSATVQTNVLIADKADETDVANCIPIQLPSGDIRTGVNLKDNPGNLGKVLEIKGSIENYFGTTGVKSATDCKIDGSAPSGSGSSSGTTTEGTIYSEAFTSSIGQFLIVDVTTNSNISEIWKQNSSYGMVATGYASSANYDTESWLVSPEINLTGASNVSLSFDQAFNYFSSIDTAKEEAKLMVRESGKEWSQITGYTYPSSLSWTYVNSGDIDLSSYVGKTVQFAFSYKSTATKAGTWEIKNFAIKGTGGTVGSNPGK